MDLKLSGKVALVTGASAGIGLAIAKSLIAEGATVVMPGRQQSKLDHIVEELIASGDASRIHAIEADVTTAAGSALVFERHPVVDILVNNLGIYESRRFETITDDIWEHYFQVNVLSGARLARHYLPGMFQRDWGRVIFISSDSALVIPPDMIHYGMTKTAQLAISRGLAGLTKGTNVTVNSVLAGSTRSEGIESFLKSVASDPNASPQDIEKEFFEKERPTSLLQRMIEPEEIAALVTYVASPLSSATNGAALRADGGTTPTVF